MRKEGSVTVTFALVFLVLFSFILSFFEMASYTARASYHASAARLAVENYFAAFLEPLYDEYHIFAREMPKDDNIISRSEELIGEDVLYMTEKQEGEKSLLLRSGASFEVTDAKVLTEDSLEGFYGQAVTAMKYRSVLEVTELLKQMAGMTEQADAHLEVAAAKAATDSAYSMVDGKILELIGLVDGVDIVKYEKFLGGKGVLFQKDVYVKYFCTAPASAASYFDRTEIYQAFLENYENPCFVLEDMIIRAETLIREMKNREDREMFCRSGLAAANGMLAVAETELKERKEQLKELREQRAKLRIESEELMGIPGAKEKEKEVLEQIAELDVVIKEATTQKEQCEEEVKQWKEEQKKYEKEQKQLDEEEKDQIKRVEVLQKEEKEFVKQAEKVRDICGEAYDCAEEIRQELAAAKKVKATCETVLDGVQTLIGKDAVKEYREELDKYSFYEEAEGFEFDRIKETLLRDKSCLWNLKQHLTEADIRPLELAVEAWRTEKEAVENYSFEGLKLNYGEMSLAGDVYDGIEHMLSEKAADGLLGFFTEKELSEKELDTSYLPSGFRYEETETDIFSLLGTDMSDLFDKLREFLPSDTSGTGVTDTILFHSYLTTHFSEFTEEKKGGALSYEQEYLIAGKSTDQENLSSVAMRICAIRTILQFVSLFTDSTRKAPVEQAALAACGVIGLPALKSIVVLLLLFVWALEEAMIDTSALLEGKKLLLYPGKAGGSLQFSELLLFSKSFVLEKARGKKDAKGVAFGYDGFLHLFLFMTKKEDKSYRAIDLVQENLRKSYCDEFRVDRCVWKLSYRVDGKAYEYSYR
ncbi:MAG: hypothetical protein IKB07_11740 [Lachnospiraceae bacterium]|nr:hypothetical protein [Lachnospiraceae bacterium]